MYGYDNTMVDMADKYLQVMEWARKRYTKDSTLVISVGAEPAPYSKIEKMAAKKYLGLA